MRRETTTDREGVTKQTSLHGYIQWAFCAKLLGGQDKSYQDYEMGAFVLKEVGKCSSEHPHTPFCQPLLAALKPPGAPRILLSGNTCSLRSLLSLSLSSSNHSYGCQASGKDSLHSLCPHIYRRTKDPTSQGHLIPPGSSQKDSGPSCL